MGDMDSRRPAAIGTVAETSTVIQLLLLTFAFLLSSFTTVANGAITGPFVCDDVFTAFGTSRTIAPTLQDIEWTLTPPPVVTGRRRRDAGKCEHEVKKEKCREWRCSAGVHMRTNHMQKTQ